MGIKESRFSSRPIHIENQVCLERAMSVPDAVVDKNRGVDGREVSIKLRWESSPPKCD